MGKMEILRGDITGVDVDVIVNAANSSLMGDQKSALLKGVETKVSA